MRTKKKEAKKKKRPQGGIGERYEKDLIGVDKRQNTNCTRHRTAIMDVSQDSFAADIVERNENGPAAGVQRPNSKIRARRGGSCRAETEIERGAVIGRPGKKACMMTAGKREKTKRNNIIQ